MSPEPDATDPVTDLRTLRDYIRWATTRFAGAQLVYGHGTATAFDEACALVLGLLQLDHALPESWFDAALTVPEKQMLVAAITRRVEERIPVPYLLNEAWFAGLSFYVDERVIIPRSPIAELIQEGFSPWLDEHRPARILDLCTGSGCIAIALAYAFPDARIDAVDLDPAALEVAALNVERHGVKDHVRLVRSDLFEALGDERYDLIVTNPPYVDAQDMAVLPEEFRHEPGLALASGEQGLDAMARILDEAPRRLNDHGILVGEVGNSKPALMERYPEQSFVWPEFRHGGEGVFVLTAARLSSGK